MTHTGDAPPPVPATDLASPELEPPSFDAAVPATLGAALGAAVGHIARAAAEPDGVEMVHDARKGLKEYRALLRLLESELARAARHAAAEVARGLAQARDAAAAQEALDLLDQSGVILLCDLQAARAVVGTPAALDAAPLRARLMDFIADARARLDGGLGAEAEGVDPVEGLRRSYRAARRGRFGDPLAMHETRKRVVAHRYQMGFLAGAAAGRGATRARRAQRLRDLLGAHHDMEVLRRMLRDAAPPLEEGVVARLGVAMARLQKRLKRRAQALHRTLFHASSRHFARKWRRRLAAARAA
ncbi:CHAD domain-containing protein [Xanthobacter agilis]|uniref:CHAD domain-containing protein n=1 Tax=Xanthobacter agilis TaxID=47492 RepID=A0ABU0LH05_XANAG|nr:CHAD domain-containing protein [Xanthobacter agilis]MDQ0506393.1 CHAD domain-containing protein [Xanthobacter agilis]